MITLAQAKALTRNNTLHHETNKNADGTCQRWRINGQAKTWKRDESRVRVPIKHGLYRYDALTESELSLVHLESECGGI